MYTANKPKYKRGFTMAELVIVVAIIAILSCIAIVFINPQDLSYTEYNRSAEAIATAVQNRLTEIRNSGDMAQLRALGESASKSGIVATAGEASGSAVKGGYRYVFNYEVVEGAIVKKDISYILPFGTIEYNLSQHYFAIGFQADTGMVGEVFYSEQPIGDCSVSYLLTLSGDKPEKQAARKAANVGYYKGTIDAQEVAFANLPTPQLTIVNSEELTLSIYLPAVKQLQDMGKQIGILVSLSDKNGKIYSEKKLEYSDTAIYSTYPLGDAAADNVDPSKPSVVSQEITSGTTYKIILDTVKKCNTLDLQNKLGAEGNPSQASDTPPKGKFEDWAKKSAAYDEGTFELGDNSVITVTVYCLYSQGDSHYNENYPVDPTYIPRSASVTFNGWFDNYNSSSVDISCGRHLQNLGKLTEMRPELTKYLPTATLGADGKYTYGSYNSGSADAYTDGSSNIEDSEEYFYYKAEGGKGNFTKNDDGTYEEVEEGKGEYNRIKNPNYSKNSNLSYEDVTQKYIYRDHIKKITIARQINAIDFDCAEWKDIDFIPVNLPYGFYYYGNYLTISNLNVDAPFYAGLFGYVYHPHLYDILLVNPYVKSQVPEQIAELYEIGVGGLIGTSRDSSDIYNCQVYMTPDSRGVYDATRRVEGKCYVGGLIGFCEDEDIQNCSASVYVGYAYGSSELSRYVGGLLGCITGDSTVANCYAAGNLTGQYVGGLVGYIVQDTDPSGDDYRIYTCYTAGHIEYASEQAAGILGYVQEFAGNAKSALSVYGNYCVVIYGVKEGSAYSWKDGAPIYGTFEGDGVEWIRTASAENSAGEYFEYYDTYFTGEYADRTFFAGAMFEEDNRNYYIAQRGITYADSSSDGSYYAQMLQVAQDFIDDANGTTDLAALKNKAEAVRQKVFWISKLQALEEMKAQMEQLIKDVESEPLSNDENATIWLEYDRSTFHTSHSSDQNEYEVTLLQAIYAIYNGTFTDTSGNKYENKGLTYAGSTKDLRNTATGISTYTFMGFYNKLKDAFKTLVDSPNDEAALKVVTSILGEDDGTKNTGDSSDTQFYKSGYMYRIFYERLLYGAFDHAKDIYQTAKENAVETAAKLEAEGKSAEAAEQLAQADVNLKNELVMRHFRDDLAGRNFRNLAVDLGMSAAGRDYFLAYAKRAALQEGIDGKKDSHYGLNDLTTIMDEWTGDMKSLNNEGNRALVTTAIAKIQALQDALGRYSVGSKELDDAIKAAHDALQDLWEFFDQNKDTVDVVSPDGSKTGDMRNLRSIVESYCLKVVWMCNATPNSGVMGALDELAVKADRTDVTAADLLNDFKVKINQYKVSDGGTKVRDAAELRTKIEELAQERQDLHKSDSSFMYNYNEKYSGQENPYRERYKLSNDTGTHYVDADNNVYNNVFPYLESTYTRYYPFPFVFGRELENVDFQASFILFHYGDWLTEDLWVNSTINYHTDYPEIADFDGEPIVLPSELVTASDAETFEPDDVDIRARDEDIDTPFYFEGWYMDAALTIPYSNEYYQQIKDNALNGNESKTFDLYAKWITKPSLTFYAGDLKGSSGLINITVDTTMTLDVLNNDSKVSNKDNSYQKYTVWLKPGQNVTISVKGSYYYNLTYNEDGPVLEKGSEPIYIIDSLTIVSPTEFTGTAPWFDESNIVKEKGTVTFSVPAKATTADNYELTLSAELGSGDGGSQFTLCLAEGTMIRMADGSLKSIEALEVGDMVLAFNHLSGRYEATALLMTPHTELGAKLYNVTTLSFFDGYKLRIVGEHGLFDRTLNKYVFINETNYSQYIGHKFSAVSVSGSIVEDRAVTLESVSVDGEITRIYSPITENHLNIVADDLLTVTSMMGYGDAVVNIFAYNADMSFDLEQMNADILKYGVYGYDDFADLLPQEVWDKVPLGIMKVAVGKGLISYEEVRQIVIYIYENGYLS